MTEEERRRKFAEKVNANRQNTIDTHALTLSEIEGYEDMYGGTAVTKNASRTMTPAAYNNRYGHILKSQAYMSLSNDDKKVIQLNNQVNAYKKAKDVFDKISYSERNSTSKKSDSWQKSKNLVDNLKNELRTQYQSIYGVDADFDKWLGSAVLQGVNQFNVGLANTGAMAGNLIPSAINEATRYLKFGTDVGSTAQLRTAEELNDVKGSTLYGTMMGGWVNQYEKAIGKPDEEMRGWLNSYEKLKHRASELSAKGNYNEADIYNNRAQEFYDRISKKYENYLKSNGTYWSIAEGDDLLSEYAQMVNDVYAREQENYEKQLEFQKMTASGSGKGYEIAGQLVTSAVAALPYAGLSLMTGGASLAQFVPEGHTLVNAATLSGSGIGAQLAPQTTDIIGKVSNILTSFGKDPQYWLSFAQEAGNTYKEAIDAGADANVATLTATLVGLINGAIELGFGGDNAGIQDLPEKLLKGKGAGTRRAIQEWIESAISEGKEEILQGVISNLAEKIAYNKDMKWIGEGGVIDPKALAQEGYMGGAVGALLGGGQIMGVNIMNESMQNRIDQANARLGQRYSEQADTIVQNARQMGPETRSYQLASDILEKGSHTDAEIGELYRAYMGDTGYNQNLHTNTIQAVQQRLTELGETSNTRELAEIIAKEADGQKITKAETRAIENSKYGQRVVNELFNAYRGDYSSNWVRGLVTQDEMAAAKAAPELTQEQRAERIESIEQNRPERTEEDYKDIDKLAQKYGEQANVFKEAAKSVEGTDLYYFDDAYHLVYQEAKAGLSEDTIRRDVKASLLSPAAFKLAYNAGQSEIKMPKGSRFTGSAGVRLNGIDYKSLNNKQRASVRALQTIAQITGIRIELFDSTQADGTLGEKQGWYSKGAIGIDINAGMLDKGDILNVAMLRTTSHELTHFIQDNNDTAYKELKDFVFSALQTYQFSDGKYRDADTWIRSKMSQNKWEYEEGTAEFNKYYQQASDECVADACEMMLRDSTAFETLAKENQSLAQRMLDWLKQLIADIKKAFSGVVETSLEARAMLDSLDELQKKWDAALVGAVQNTKEAESDQQSETETQNSVRVKNEFEVTQPVERTKDLIALHNLTEDKLLKSIQLGGFPMPSIAVTRSNIPHTNFGDITLVMNRSTVDPLLDKRNTVYSADAWTPTFPEIEYEVDDKVESRISKKYYALAQKFGYDFMRPLYEIAVVAESALNRNGGEQGIIEKLRNDTGVQNIFLADTTGKPVEDIKKTTTKRISDQEISQNEFFIDRLGEDVINEITPRDGERVGDVRRRWVHEHMDDLDSAIEDYYRSLAPDLSEDKLSEAIEVVLSDSTMNKLLTYVVKARNYLSNGPETSTTENDVAAKNAAIRDRTNQNDYEAWLRDLIGGIEKSSGIWNNKEYYTPSGNRRSFSSTHYPATLENIAKAMSGKNGGDTKNVSGFVGIKTLRAATAKRFASIDEMHEYEDRLQHLTEAEAAQISDELSDKMMSLISDIYASKTHSDYENQFIEIDNIGNMLSDAAELNSKSIDGIRRLFKDRGYGAVTDKTIKQVTELFDEVSAMPVNIFEAKPERAVRFDEVLAAVIPDDASNEVRNKLQEVGVNVIEYKHGDNNERLSAVNSVDDAQFSRRVTPEQDERYLELAKDPQKNEAELRKMVEQAARLAGFKSPMLFHGTEEFGFTRIRTSELKPRYDWTPFFATNKKATAATYTYDGADVREIGKKRESIPEIKKALDGIDENRDAAIKAISEMDKWLSKSEIKSIQQSINSYAENTKEAKYITKDRSNAAQRIINQLTESGIDDITEVSKYLQEIDTLGEDIPYDNKLGIYSLYANTSKMLVIEGNGGNWDAINTDSGDFWDDFNKYYGINEGDWLYGKNVTTRTVAEYAYAKGYAGVQFNNIVDKGTISGNYSDLKPANVYVFFNPQTQVKSADIVTYDDSGNPIPLSERFRTDRTEDVWKNEDIRYSRRVTDSTGQRLTDAQVEYFENSKVRDKQGNLLRVYHGTNNEFDVFDPNGDYKEFLNQLPTWARKPGDDVDSIGFSWATPEIIRAEHFGDVIKEGYLNITKMLDIGEIEGYANYDRAISELANVVGLSEEELSDMDEGAFSGTIYNITRSKKFADYVASLGYDGVMARENGVVTYGFINSNQFKNADNLNPTENEDIRYQLREQISTREALAVALMNITENEDERTRLVKYIDGIEKVDTAQARVSELGKQIHDIMFTKGSDRSNLATLRAEKNKLEKDIERYDKMLIGLQSTKPLKDLRDRALARANAELRNTQREDERAKKELVKNYTVAFNSLARSDARQLAITAKELARMTSRVESFKRAANRRETTAIKNTIKKTVDEWRTQLEDKAKGKHIPRQLVIAVADMASVLDTTANTVSGLKKFTELQALYSQLKNDKDYKDAYDTSVAGMFDSLVEVIDDTPLSEMNYEQLSKVYDIVKAMKKTIAEARQTKSKEYKQNIFDTGKAIINEMIEASPSFKSKRLEAIHIWQLDPESFFVGELAGFKKDAVWGQIARSFTEGTKRATMVEMAHQNHFANFITSRDIRRLTNWKKTIDVGLVDMKTGKKVMMPRGAALGMYMHTLGEDNQLALIYGTLHVPGNWKTYYTGNAAESYGGEPIRVRTEGNAEAINNIKELGKKIDELKDNDDLTREEKQKLKEKYQNQQMEYEQQALGEIQAVRDRIYSQMTETEKKYVEAIQQWFDGPAKNFANEVTMELWDVKKAQVKNYWPMHRDKAFIQSGDIGASVEDVNLSNAGWLKQRVRSSAPIYLTDITYELDQSMRNLARFYGYAIAQRDFNKIYNVQLGSQNTSVKEQVNRFGTGPRKIGVSAETYIDNYIKDITGGRVTAGDSIISLIRRTHPRATLTGSIRVWFSQLASLPTAAAEVGWDSAAKGFAKGFASAFSPKFKEELARKSPTYWQRYKGQGGMRELAEMKQGNTAIDRGWNAVTNLPVFSAIANGTQIFDCYATANEYFMAEEWVKKHRPGLKGEEFETAVMEKYDAIIHHTQPNYTPTERSDLLRDKREGYKFLTMYKTQANKNYNMLANALGKYRKYKSDFKNKKNGVTAADVKDATRGLANTVSAVLIGETLLFVLGRALANMILGHVRDYRDDDDEITAAAIAASIGKEAVNSIAGIFAFGGQLSDALFFIFSKDHTYRGIEDSGLKTLSEGAEYTVKLIKAVADGDVDWADVERAIKSDSAMLGLPYNNLKTIYTGAVGWAKDISNHEFGTYEAFVTRSKKTNYTRLLKALEDGDAEKAENIRAELRENDPDIEDSEINSGVRSVIKDIWKDGDLTSDAAVKLMVDYTDMDADDAYWTVQKWYNKANAEDDEKYTNTDYYRLWQVIDNDGDAEAAMSELLEHGKDADQIAQDVRKHIKDAYTNGEITDTQARERMLKYGQHKENKQIVPYTKAEVDKLVNGWVTSNTLGWDYDDKETLYAKGEISKSELKTALVDIGGMTSEKADQRIEIMDWNKEGYAVENDKYDSIIGEYNKKLKSHGISKSIWYNYYIFESKTSGEVDANGKSIPYSKMRKLFEYIGNLNITSEQKMALARTYTDSESSIAKYKTW